MPMHDIGLLIGSIRRSDGRYEPVGLSVVLAVMDEYDTFFNELSREVAEHYEVLAHLAFDCAADAYDPRRADRGELIERVYHDVSRIKNIAWHTMLTANDRAYINRVANSVRARAFHLASALHRSG